MISRIRGTLLRKEIDFAEVMTQSGVAYRVAIPLTVYEKLPAVGTELELRTHQVVREDEIALYGFLDERGRLLFARLMTASGVGPRLALTMLSTLTPERIVRAIGERDLAVLTQVPGIGRKTAERIAIELGDRLDGTLLAGAAVDGTLPATRKVDDAVKALVALGYHPTVANTAVRKAMEENEGAKGVDLIKAALGAAAAAK
ncbi:MAG TPA: Holliday junction branch migration protein RuvA [Longimicrobiales bacterium]|nr:Holliday junction branch migration protein RuvA [Longimicrobiales bacterium]